MHKGGLTYEDDDGSAKGSVGRSQEDLRGKDEDQHRDSLTPKLIEAKKIERLRSLRGKLDLDVDLKRLRKDRTAAH